MIASSQDCRVVWSTTLRFQLQILPGPVPLLLLPARCMGSRSKITALREL